MTTAFVLTGGGSLGAGQVGMLHVLAERDVRPGLLVGTSVGALNAAYVAGRGFSAETVAELEAIWRSVRRVVAASEDGPPLSASLDGRRAICKNNGDR